MKNLRLAGNIVVTVVVLLFFFIAAVSFFSAPEGSGLFGLKGYVVVSGSMEPALSPGDFIMTSRGSFDEIRAGDVITFVGDKEIVTHRVEDVSVEGLTTKGDANEYPDASKVLREDYIGSHLVTLAYFGHVIILLQKPLAFILLSVAFAGYFILVYIRDGRENEEDNEAAG